MSKSSPLLCVAAIFLSACVGLLAAGIISDQKGIKSSEELTGNRSYDIIAPGDYLIHNSSTYSDHAHVFVFNKDAILYFYDQDSSPCLESALEGLVTLDTIGVKDIHHRFNQGMCVRVTSPGTIDVRVHYNIG